MTKIYRKQLRSELTLTAYFQSIGLLFMQNMGCRRPASRRSRREEPEAQLSQRPRDGLCR